MAHHSDSDSDVDVYSEFNDTDDEKPIEFKKSYDHRNIMICPNCGGNFQINETKLECESCHMTSDISIDDIIKISDTIPVVKGPSIEQRKYTRYKKKNNDITQVNCLEFEIPRVE